MNTEQSKSHSFSCNHLLSCDWLLLQWFTIVLCMEHELNNFCRFCWSFSVASFLSQGKHKNGLATSNRIFQFHMNVFQRNNTFPFGSTISKCDIVKIIYHPPFSFDSDHTPIMRFCFLSISKKSIFLLFQFSNNL